MSRLLPLVIVSAMLWTLGALLTPSIGSTTSTCDEPSSNGIVLQLQEIVPRLSGGKLDQYDVVITSDDVKALASYKYFHVGYTLNRIRLSIHNRTTRHYVLSRHDICESFAQCLSLTDNNGGEWKFESTVKGGCDFDHLFDVVVLAGTTRTFDFTLSMADLKKTNTKILPDESDIPPELAYSIRVGYNINARILEVESLGDIVQVPIEGSGRCRVALK
jgi:hypothetical protein